MPLRAIDVRRKNLSKIEVLLQNGFVDTDDRLDAWLIRRSLPNMTTIEKTGRTSRRISLVDPSMKLVEIRPSAQRFRARIILDTL